MNRLVLTLSIAAVALGAATGYTAYRLAAQSDNLNAELQTNRHLAARIAELEQLQDSLTARNRDLMALAERNAADSNPVLVAADAASETKQCEPTPVQPVEDTLALMAKSMDDPERRPRLLARQKNVIAISLSDMGRELSLSDAQEDRLLDVLAEHELRQRQTMLASRNADPAATRAEREQMLRSQQAELTALLGADKYREYVEYRDTEPDRERLKEFRGILDGDTAMKKTQEDQLMALLGEERKRREREAPKFQGPLHKAELEQLSQHNRKARLESDRRILEKAAGILSQEQMARFTELRQRQAAARR